MELQEIFYLVSTIALILLSLFLTGVIYLMYRLQKFIRFSTDRMDQLSRHIGEQLSNTGRAWGKVTITNVLLRMIRRIIFNR
jgi:cbb3-type cytochrome oxidase subunit 3